MASLYRGTGTVFTINNPGELMTCLKDDDGKKLVVLEFMAAWSEPCKSMAEPYRQLAIELGQEPVKLCTIDFNKFKDLGRRLRVDAMPTFLLVKEYSVVDRLITLKKEDLRKRIDTQLQHL
ncbi:thioredoxin H-type 2-like [Oryza glaberrima]|uniref:thioredoxin H-type 2-like n=1 Tax=Oryza glaberrima TaxID=4538 RepID=UPI00224C00D0|nr:thioredoxin H-type 2-like [Oryza glaberrima]